MTQTATHKPFPPRWETIQTPVVSRAAARGGVMMYAPCKPTGRLVRWLAWQAVTVAGPRTLPGRARPLAPPASPDVWSEVLGQLREAVGRFDAVAAYAPPQSGRPGGAILLLDGGRARAFVKVRPASHDNRCEVALRLLEQDPPSAFWAPRILGTGGADDVRWVAMSSLPVQLHRPARCPALDRISADTERCLTGLPRPGDVPPHWVPMHGDLTPWNLRRAAGGRLLLLDWDDVGWGPPGADVVYFQAVASALWGGRPPRASDEVAAFWRERVVKRAADEPGRGLQGRLERALVVTDRGTEGAS